MFNKLLKPKSTYANETTEAVVVDVLRATLAASCKKKDLEKTPEELDALVVRAKDSLEKAQRQGLIAAPLDECVLNVEYNENGSITLNAAPKV